MSQKISMIAAASENNGLGKNNELVWHLPDDFKRFKQITSGHYIIMGRKTFESFPKPLPNRTHIIITRDKKYTAENCLIAHSLDEAFVLAKADKNPFVIGGGEIYHLALPYADEIELTRVHTKVEADAFFPEIPENEWELVAEEFHPEDERHKHSFTYQTFKRI
ncbi:dihydrofolate reductase [Psychroflexus planctonicus]|uniref:Dihydrofolate reductase n=1 Tax=Psychroflexus planctonicus TaxID=1526575 RepID=A0ABQ1SJ47_9FLAO|nr:dihydrofolate reductase [Psychroflexus planctonicus]GGE38880.1 dihydrofolate reductase [Psychroflexus planctonicus]